MVLPAPKADVDAPPGALPNMACPVAKDGCGVVESFEALLKLNVYPEAPPEAGVVEVFQDGPALVEAGVVGGAKEKPDDFVASLGFGVDSKGFEDPALPKTLLDPKVDGFACEVVENAAVPNADFGGSLPGVTGIVLPAKPFEDVPPKPPNADLPASLPDNILGCGLGVANPVKPVFIGLVLEAEIAGGSEGAPPNGNTGSVLFDDGFGPKLNVVFAGALFDDTAPVIELDDGAGVVPNVGKVELGAAAAPNRELAGTPNVDLGGVVAMFVPFMPGVGACGVLKLKVPEAGFASFLPLGKSDGVAALGADPAGLFVGAKLNFGPFEGAAAVAVVVTGVAWVAA